MHLGARDGGKRHFQRVAYELGSLWFLEDKRKDPSFFLFSFS